MKSLWNDDEARHYTGDLALRVYTSRLLGRDTTLVLHGGGNTSVKITEKNILGNDEDLLYVKGSGWDLEAIEAGGFSPVRLNHMLALAQLENLSDPQMVNEMVTHMTRASAPTPSVETILHATLPYKYVDHTHADAIVTLTNTEAGLNRVKKIYGQAVVIIPYIMPGFDLARLCAQEFASQAHKDTLGMILMNHGIFSFGKTAQESYQRMIDLVTRAEQYLERKNAWSLPAPVPAPITATSRISQRQDIARLRQDISKVTGMPMILCVDSDPRSLDFARRPDIATLSQQGPATPDHVIRTKRLPMLGRDVDAYAAAYKDYFNTHAAAVQGCTSAVGAGCAGAATAKEPKTMLDAAPRVVLDTELGLCTVGRTTKDAAIAKDIYQHTIEIILRATALGGWQALPAKDIFDMEYWDLEQAKLRKGSKPPQFTGEIALVTGAASGIGKACVDALLARGAAVIGLDINPAITTLYKRQDFLGQICDVTDETQLCAALESGVRAFGGLDMLILNAGIFPPSRRIEALSSEEWRKVMNINLDANLALLREAHPLLKCAPKGGRVVIIGSKNVPAPGPGAAAYSTSKAALNQLARVAALEWGKDGIRINSLHPNAVFDTGIWSDDILQARAAHYGMSVEQYKRNNVLGVDITSCDVGELAAEMCGPLFAKTTAAQVPVDGGNERVI